MIVFLKEKNKSTWFYNKYSRTTKNANNQYLISNYKIRNTDQQKVGQSMQIKVFVLSSKMIPFYGSFLKSFSLNKQNNYMKSGPYQKI